MCFLKEVKAFCLEKIERKSWQRVDTKLGRYLSASRVWKKEGGEPEDIEPTMKLIKKAVTMGPPWVKFNTRTERLDLLYFEESVSEVFEQSWELYQRGKVTGQHEPSGTGAQVEPAKRNRDQPSPQQQMQRTGSLRVYNLGWVGGGVEFLYIMIFRNTKNIQNIYEYLL